MDPLDIDCKIFSDPPGSTIFVVQMTSFCWYNEHDAWISDDSRGINAW